MNPKSLQTLEYNSIIESLVSKAVSPMGKARAQALTPMVYIGDINRAQAETTAAVGYILRKGSLPLGGITDIENALARAQVGGMLQAEELLQIADSLYVCRKVVAYGTGEQPESCLNPYFDGISQVDTLEKEISRCIKSNGEIADNASAELGEVRGKIRVSQDKIRDKLNSVIQSAAYKNMLQDPIITMRGNRFCVPVKAENRSSFPGMVHDQSATGATVFMEPLSVIELNNSIKNLHFEEQRQIEAILYKLSALVESHLPRLRANIDQIAYLDFVFAKAELSLAMEACEPKFNDRRFVHIIKGRHPLLARDSVVPTEIYIGGDFNMLLITGPNTGGKTVSLKTLGLLTCMGQAGLHIPAAQHSELAVFDDVFADIGDEQSISQSLSTFSSHMKNIVSILDGLSHNALVLLDELGAGTDPTEGAALAIAILEHLRERQIRTAVTTHYSELKLFALSVEGVENASCEFDVETLRPTYRLLIGVPGKSNAFAIARRLGLPENIIEEARKLLTQKDIRFEDVITDLEASKKIAEEEQSRALTFRREAEKMREYIAAQEAKLASQREKIIQQAKLEALNTVQQAQKEANDIIAKMQKQLSTASQRELDDAKRQMRDGFSSLAEGVRPAQAPRTHKAPLKLRQGDTVLIHFMNQTATVLAPPGPNGDVQLMAGILKIKAHISELSLEEAEEKYAPKTKSNSIKMKSLNIATEIDLRGMLPEEATHAAEKYLDDAFLSSLTVITLIHGKGTGAVRNAVHALLKRHPHVQEYRLGKYGEGEAGVTVVTLK